MTAAEIAAAAEALFQAEETGRQIGLLSLAHPGMTMDDAYAVQKALVARRAAAGRRVIGWKIGLTSKAMQAALHIDIPDSGVLMDDMAFDSGAVIPRGRFIQPRVEAEIAFVMKAPLAGETVTRADVVAATDYVAPALEILDTRILRADPATGQTRKIFDTIADNAANAGIVMSAHPVRPDAVDLRWVGALLYRNDVIEETGLAAGVLDHPANGLAWLAARLSPWGEHLAAGEIVLAGSFTRIVAASPGDRFRADYGPLGTLTVNFG